MKWLVDVEETKSSLIIQIQMKKIELTKFLHEHKMSNFDHTNCLCRVDEQTSKQVIINCVLLSDASDI